MNIESKLIKCNFDYGRTANGINYKPEAIVIHIAQGWLQGAYAHFSNPQVCASAHFMVGKKGEVWKFVEEENTAWHAGIDWNRSTPTHKFVTNRRNVNPNLYTIGIEHEGFTGEAWTEEQKKASRELIATLCVKWNIPCSYSNIFGHEEVNPQDRAGCPGMGIHLTNDIINPAKAIIEGKQPPVVIPNNLIKKTYTVQPGDALEKIALKLYGTINRTNDLINWNKGKYFSLLSNPDLIFAGWELDYYVAEAEDVIVKPVPVEIPGVLQTKEYKELMEKYNELIKSLDQYKVEKEAFYQDKIVEIAEDLSHKATIIAKLQEEYDIALEEKRKYEDAYRVENGLPLLEKIVNNLAVKYNFVGKWQSFIDNLSSRKVPLVSWLFTFEEVRSLAKFDWAYVIFTFLLYLSLYASQISEVTGIDHLEVLIISLTGSLPFKWAFTTIKRAADKNQDGIISKEDTVIIKELTK